MKKRKLGHSDLYVSEIGLGCMSLGTEEAQAKSIIDEAIHRGINYFDTADLYDYGLNEEFVGKALKGRREEMILATKAGNHWEKGKESWYWDPSKAYIKEAVKESLRRLGTDYIDLYQLHGGTIDDPIDETIEAFEELKTEGLIRWYGISSIRPNVMMKYLEKSSIVSIMMQYSLLDRRPEEWFPLIKERDVSVIARGPMAKGLLTERPVESASESVKEKGYLSYSYEELKQVRTSLKDAAPRHTLTETAVQYCLYDHTVGALVPGASKKEQLLENCRAAEAEPLFAEEYEALQKASKAEIYETHRSS
ncbi:aldo/keto reductase [Metabacillus sp. GX 13764]|uniref:aldo/keto reductase n=1 Tax=Metabacillus kandeliae TaxID=2900151 RepID=UPI001E64D98C|nr:aldo/keto reductase [Metabacillus kandeliae]MCD7033277.1 aldo/keto reductase [Metabacillus kandeliae]